MQQNTRQGPPSGNSTAFATPIRILIVCGCILVFYVILYAMYPFGATGGPEVKLPIPAPPLVRSEETELTFTIQEYSSKAKISRCVEKIGNHSFRVQHGISMDDGAVGAIDCGQVVDIAGGCCRPEHRPMEGDFIARNASVYNKQVILLRHSHDLTFYHLMFETLPRLQCLSEDGFDLSQTGIVLAAPKSALMYQRAFPQFYFHDSEDRIIGDIIIPCTVNSIQPRHISGSFTYLKKRIVRTTVSGHQPKQPYIVLLSRFGYRREMHNRYDVIKMLEKEFMQYNFISMGERLSPFTLKETIQIFKAASGVVGMHGAGLTNACWMDKPGFLLEIRPPNQHGLVYGKVANVCGHRYYFVEGNEVSGKPDAHYANVLVNIEILAQKLRDALSLKMTQV